MTTEDAPYWEAKTLTQLSPAEWEALCDGCGKCCLHKLEDEDTGKVHYTNVACRLLDLNTIRCKNYGARKRFVPDCVSLTPEIVASATWLPKSCAYRLIHQGKPLPDWHPLISGELISTQRSGNSIKDLAVAEQDAGDLQAHVIIGVDE